MGFMTSEPIPVSQRIGMRLARTAHTVIYCGLDILVFEGSPGCQSAIERLVQVHNHDHACLDGDSEKRDVAHPYGHAEVVIEKPLENKTAGHGIERRENQNRGFCDGMKHH